MGEDVKHFILLQKESIERLEA